jgi:very-short-patch-repair endonuclease
MADNDLNSPLEGWRTQSDGVDSSSWKEKSLYPFWTLLKNKNLKERAQQLRKAGVLSEVLFWKTFKNKEILGWDIDRQVIIGNYIVDFFIAELGLVFEIDGVSHDSKFEYDIERNNFLLSLGLEVIHIKDIDIKQDIDNVNRIVVGSVKGRERILREKING